MRESVYLTDGIQNILVFSFTLTLDSWDSHCLRINSGSHRRKIVHKGGYWQPWISFVNSAIAATSSVSWKGSVLMWLLVFLIANVTQQNSLLRHPRVEHNFLPYTGHSLISGKIIFF